MLMQIGGIPFIEMAGTNYRITLSMLACFAGAAHAPLIFPNISGEIAWQLRWLPTIPFFVA